MHPIIINSRTISEENVPYIIAEVSANHNGSIDRAKKTIKAAADTGASAVKIQTYTPDTMTIDVQSEDFMVSDGIWKGYSLYELYKEAHTPFEWHAELFDYAQRIGITLFSSPFDETAVDLLESLNAPAYKVASFELVDLPLIAYIAKTSKPVLMSTGMASYNEIGEALETARMAGCHNLALFHCISSYPTPIEDSNLSSIQRLKKEFNVQVGLSDHTLGVTAAISATTLGATLIEKHFTLNRDEKGPDTSFSIEPAEFEHLVKSTNDAFLSIGTPLQERVTVEESNKIFRRSLYFVEDLQCGDIIRNEHVRRIRPGFGLAPKYLSSVIGKTITQDVKRGDRVSWKLLDDKNQDPC